MDPKNFWLNFIDNSRENFLIRGTRFQGFNRQREQKPQSTQNDSDEHESKGRKPKNAHQAINTRNVYTLGKWLPHNAGSCNNRSSSHKIRHYAFRCLCGCIQTRSWKMWYEATVHACAQRAHLALRVVTTKTMHSFTTTPSQSWRWKLKF